MRTLQGRLISRERVVQATNQKVTFYSIGTVKGWFQVTLDKSIDIKKIEVPGLVEIDVTSARVKTNVTEDGRTFENKSVYVVAVRQIESAPEYEAFEAARLDEKLGY